MKNMKKIQIYKKRFGILDENLERQVWKWMKRSSFNVKIPFVDEFKNFKSLFCRFENVNEWVLRKVKGMHDWVRNGEKWETNWNLHQVSQMLLSMSLKTVPDVWDRFQTFICTIAYIFLFSLSYSYIEFKWIILYMESFRDFILIFSTLFLFYYILLMPHFPFTILDSDQTHSLTMLLSFYCVLCLWREISVIDFIFICWCICGWVWLG